MAQNNTTPAKFGIIVIIAVVVLQGLGFFGNAIAVWLEGINATGLWVFLGSLAMALAGYVKKVEA